MVVARGVILAAGRGTRLGTLLEGLPKPMLTVAGAPLIERTVAAMAAAGVGSLVVVTGHHAAILERHVAATSSIPVAFVRQEQPLGTAAALLVARPALGTEPFLLAWGDIATAPEHYAMVARALRPGTAGAVAVNQMEDVGQGAAVVFDHDGRIGAIVEKPQPPAPSNWNNSGLMALTAAIWDPVAAIAPSARGELDLTDAIGLLVAGGARVVAVPLPGAWFDIGTPQQLQAARDSFGP